METPKEKLNQFYNQKPKYTITVKYGKLTYNLNIYRKLTIIQGDSGIGKTFMLKILSDEQKLSASTTLKHGQKVISPVEYSVNPIDMPIHSKYKVIFFDEDNNIALSPHIMNELLNEGRYVVIITRKLFKKYTYPVSELYTISPHMVSEHTKEINNNFYRIYDSTLIHTVNRKTYDLVITEDGKSGYYFYKNYFTTEVITANGKNNIIQEINKYIKLNKYANILVIFDSANFGQEIGSIVKLKEKSNIDILSFECFEFLILQSVKLYNKLAYYLNNNLMRNSEKFNFNMEILFNILLTCANKYADSLVEKSSIIYNSEEVEKLIISTIPKDAYKYIGYNKSADICDRFNEKMLAEINNFLDELLKKDKEIFKWR